MFDGEQRFGEQRNIVMNRIKARVMQEEDSIS